MLDNRASLSYSQSTINKKNLMENFEKQLMHEKEMMIEIPSIVELNSERRLAKNSDHIRKYEHEKKNLLKQFHEQVSSYFLRQRALSQCNNIKLVI
jgi:hypothetical protein